MTTRKPSKPVRWRDRAVRSARAHPWLTWGGAASAVTVIAAAIAGVLWVDARYQTAEAAGAHERNHRQERGEILYQLARQESLILRRAVNECRARADKPGMRAACADYEAEYRAATQRERVLYEQMQRGGK